jgi:hypothetical protein
MALQAICDKCGKVTTYNATAINKPGINELRSQSMNIEGFGAVQIRVFVVQENSGMDKGPHFCKGCALTLIEKAVFSDNEHRPSNS